MMRPPSVKRGEGGGGYRWRALPALLALLAAVFLWAPAAADDETYPDIQVSTTRDPSPGEEFSTVFTLTSHQSANYTITISPRPEFAFTDGSNGSKTYEVPVGRAVDFIFPMRVSRSAAEGEYLFSYTVVRDGATVKMDTFTVKVGRMPCTFAVILLPPLAVFLALVRRRGYPRPPGEHSSTSKGELGPSWRSSRENKRPGGGGWG
ncbi:MAG: hypothetical protein QW379_00395 [Thermoplasmata archaeon]